MKKFTAIMMVLGMVLFLGAAQVSAQHFSFGGNFTIADTNSTGFSETITFSSGFPLGMFGSGLITYSDPSTDAVFNDLGMEYVGLPTLILSETSFVSGVSYDFAPNLYDNGFVLYDDDGSILFTADLTVTSLMTDQTIGYINPAFSLNLSDITVGAGYAGKSSFIVDSFIANGGATSITLQLAGKQMATVIEGGQTQTNSYSGTAAAAAVPEPATMLLLGSGLLGLLGIRRKQN